MYFLFQIILTVLARDRDCTTLKGDEFTFTAKSKEIITLNLKEIFPETDQEKYQLADPLKRFTMISPIYLLESGISSLSSTSIIDFRVQKNKFNEWVNNFIAIGELYMDKYSCFQSWGQDEAANARLPILNFQRNLDKLELATYGEFVIIDQKTILIDCSLLVEGVTTYFFELWNWSTKAKITNQFPFDGQPRHMLNSDTLIYRWAPKTNDHPAIIQIYKLNVETETIELQSTIDEAAMKEMVKEVIPDYSFDLVEIKVSVADEVALIDKAGNFITLHNNLGTWAATVKILKAQQPHSFDYNFEAKNLIVVFDGSLELITNENDQVIQIQNLADFKGFFSKSFICLVSETQVQLFNFNLKQIHSLDGEFQLSIFDQTQDDFLSITRTKFYHYLLSDSFKLQYQSDKDSDEDWWWAIINSGNCFLDLNFYNVERLNTHLLSKGRNTLISTALFPSAETKIPMNRLVQGPNVKLEIKQQGFSANKLKLDVQYSQTQKIPFVTEKNIFTHIYSNPELETMQIILIINQTEDLKVHIIYCTSRIPNIVCEEKLEFAAPISFIISNPSFHYDSKTLQIGYLNGLDLIVNIFDFTSFQLQTTTEKLKEEYAIDKVLYSTDLLLLYSTTKKLISIYNLRDIDHGELYVIEASTFAQHSSKLWDPINLFANEIQNYAFLPQSNNILIILNLKLTHFSLLYTDYITQQIDTRILIFKNHFGLLQYDQNQSGYIYIYEIKSQLLIRQTKSLPFYNYKISSLKPFYYSPYEGRVYVQLDQETVLEYLIEETSHNSLNNILKIQANQIHYTQSSLFLITENELTIMELYRQPLLVSSVQFVDNVNVVDRSAKLFYTTSFSEQIVSLDDSFRFINTQQQLYITTQNIYIQVKDKVQDSNITNINSTWYGGQGYLFTLNTQQKEIELIQPLDKQKDPYSPSDQEGKQIVSIDETTIAILYNTAFIAINSQRAIFTKIYPFAEQYTTVSIVYNRQGSILFQLKNGDQYEILSANCQQESCKGNSDTLILKELVIEIKIYGSTMFIVYEKKVEIYSLQDKYKIQEATLLGTENVIFGDYEQYGLKVYNVDKDYYNIYSNDKAGYLNIIQVKTSDAVYQMISKSSIDLRFAINDGYYITYDSNLVFPYFEVFNSYYWDNRIYFTFIFFSENEKHYVFEIPFTCSETGCQKVYCKLLYNLQEYGQLVNKPLLLDSYLTLSYKINNEVLLATYKIPSNITYDIHKQVSFFGGVKLTKPSSKPQYLMQKTNKQVSLLCFDDELLSFYNINESPKLKMNGQIKDEQFTIEVASDFAKNSTNFEIKINSNDPDDPSNEKSKLWIWILIGVIGGILIIGVAYYIYKRNSKVTEQHLLGN